MEHYSDKERDNTFHKCIDTYGKQVQVDMAVEEMSELTKALMKERRTNVDDARGAIIDEIADVRIMMRQLELIYDCEEEVDRRIDFKVMRQRQRLKVGA